MRITILVHRLTGGGAERVAALWANGFSERGHDIHVITFDDKSPQTYLLCDGIKTTSVVPCANNRLLRVAERIVRLRRTLKQVRPDVVIEVIPGWQRTIAMLGLRCKKISTEHDSFERPANATHKLNCFKKFYWNKLYDYVTVLTQADKDVIGKKIRHVTVMPNPLALTPATSVPHKDNIVLAVGRKDDWHCKGFDVLIKAWAKVSESIGGWKLQIVGGGDVEGQALLENLCLELGVADSVEFPEYQSDIQPYYEHASVFVLSSRYEGFGLVLIEAMSQGCACVACDYKGRQSEIVTNGVDGLTCKPDDLEALAGLLHSVLNDSELRTQLQTNAIRRSADFTLDKIMDRWGDIMINVLPRESNVWERTFLK